MKQKKEKIDKETKSEGELKTIVEEEIQAGENEFEKQKKELQEKTKQIDDYINRLMRLQADFENYKKRVTKEREEMYSFALESIVTDILPVLDNLDRGICSFKSDNLDAKYVDGIEMVQKLLISVMEKNGVKEIQSEGCDFDPNVHHAVMQCEACEEDENKVKLVMQKGYVLGNKVIRPSLVQVAVKS